MSNDYAFPVTGFALDSVSDYATLHKETHTSRTSRNNRRFGRRRRFGTSIDDESSPCVKEMLRESVATAIFRKTEMNGERLSGDIAQKRNKSDERMLTKPVPSLRNSRIPR